MFKYGRYFIWIYFFLLIFEGVLRKWLVPGLSAPLLFARDPIAMGLIWMALTSGRLRMNFYLVSLGLIGGMAALIGLFVLEIPIFVIYYGLKSNFLHLSLIFIIPAFFDREDVIKMGKMFIWLAPIMAVLMVMQFSLDKNHIINAGAGGSLGTQMEGAMGKIRPPGLFSFITGAAQYMSFLTAFILYGFLVEKAYARKILLIASTCLCLCAVVSISRLAVGSIVVVVLMLVPIQLFVGTKAIGRILKTLFLLLIILGIASQFSIFDSGAEAFMSRLERTGDAQVGVGGTAGNWGNRFINETFGGLYIFKKSTFWGEGLGVGTNAAAKFMTGKLHFTLAEGEWPRNLLEMGFVLGPTYIILRILIVLSILKNSFLALNKRNVLPLLLFGATALTILNGQLGQSTTAGFASLGGGLAFASIRLRRKKRNKKNKAKTESIAPVIESPLDLSQYTVTKAEAPSNIDWKAQMEVSRSQVLEENPGNPSTDSVSNPSSDSEEDFLFSPGPSSIPDWRAELEELKKKATSNIEDSSNETEASSLSFMSEDSSSEFFLSPESMTPSQESEAIEGSLPYAMLSAEEPDEFASDFPDMDDDAGVLSEEEIEQMQKGMLQMDEDSLFDEDSFPSMGAPAQDKKGLDKEEID